MEPDGMDQTGRDSLPPQTSGTQMYSGSMWVQGVVCGCLWSYVVLVVRGVVGEKPAQPGGATKHSGGAYNLFHILLVALASWHLLEMR